MALGEPQRIYKVALFCTLGLVALGLMLGMTAWRALTGLLESLLFQVTPGDPVTVVGIGALLIVVAAPAGYFPPRRASHIDPTVALRAS
jgi:putative ABC transport system permease protein